MTRSTTKLAFSLALSFVLASLASTMECDECVVADLSHWNPHIDFSVFKKAGIQGILHKATQGTGYIDPMYSSRAVEANNAAILWGAYHFGDGSPGNEQARHFLNVVQNWGRVLLALDLEETSSPMNISNAELFVQTVLGITGHLPMIYGSPSYLTGMVDENSILASCPLWLAQWGPKAEPPAPWKNYTLWQYSDGVKGPAPRNIAGYRGHVDRDRYNPALQPSLQHMWFARPV